MLYDAMECIMGMLCEASSWFLWGVTPRRQTHMMMMMMMMMIDD